LIDKLKLAAMMSAHHKAFEEMSDAIWDYAEPPFGEYRSFKLQKDFLQQQGFRITAPIGSLETAFVAEYGSGKPVIALLGEYDALEGLSQEAGLTERSPIIEGGNGHGCGHHVLGTACVEAAYAVKEVIDRQGLAGTIRYYGCPAEEGGAGKIHMLRAGAFDDVDIALTWHPQTFNAVVEGIYANLSFTYSFRGKASHAGKEPHLGRSALKAMELMNIGVQFFREHLPPEVTIQCAILDAGGTRSNIVQDHAKILYTIRSSKNANIKAVFEQFADIAKGAALMTGTTVEEMRIQSAYSDLIPNRTLLEQFIKNGEEFGPIAYSDEDYQLASKFHAVSNDSSNIVLDSSKFYYRYHQASTDVCDVSYFVPTAMFFAPVYANGTNFHSWLNVAQGKLSYAHKGMHQAAKILAGTAIDLMEDQELVNKAKQEFEDRTFGLTYSSLQPDISSGPLA
jgi:aminobenzoyl-glutamate utilization protein B